MENNPETKFLHYRYSGENGILATGGLTIAYREVAPGKILHAHAKCHPNDNFIKHQGRVKAAGRLLSKQAQTYTGTEQDFLNQVEQAISVQSMMFNAAYGVTLERKFNGKRKARGATPAGVIGN